MHALARNPDYRPESAAALAEELAIASPDPPTRPLPQTSGVDASKVLGSPTQVQTKPIERAPRRGIPQPRGRRWWLLLAAVAAAVAIAIGIAVGSGGNGGTQPPAGNPAVEPVPPASNAATQARNLADWLRDHSR
jgi:hypothetical protein